ncbi:TOBE domain-containing protein [Rhodopseudomonas palustris]|uniref:TOBE domain-containing protein n=1 Tax=Rhodopseudomonas palustris TaxID=1076 RepID=UPI002ACEB602|nr:TOBE domain-containing protein [Rhodopseudomonas palustris]WQH00235.1 TOBE domain-containing protein [Rhodopseudomonas palustris]
MADDKIDAYLELRSGGRLLVGRDRIRLLEAVAEHGSISKAAKAMGISYKTAWEAVDAINNLLPTPAFVTRTSGRVGGAAEMTEEGRRLITAFHRLEDHLARISSLIAEEGLADIGDALLWATGFKISARNIFRTEVVSVRRWPVDVEVVLKVSDEHSIHAIITNAATEQLDLAPGRKALALVKAPFVRLVSPDEASRLRRNLFRGTVVRRIDAEVHSEVHLDLGKGKTLVAVVPRHQVEDLGLVEGSTAAATFEPDHVILAAG